MTSLTDSQNDLLYGKTFLEFHDNANKLVQTLRLAKNEVQNVNYDFIDENDPESFKKFLLNKCWQGKCPLENVFEWERNQSTVNAFFHRINNFLVDTKQSGGLKLHYAQSTSKRISTVTYFLEVWLQSVYLLEPHNNLHGSVSLQEYSENKLLVDFPELQPYMKSFSK
jgi:hypothetical protein